jgi:hypothetical protein
MNTADIVFISVMVVLVLFIICIPKKWLNQNMSKSGLNSTPESPRPEPPREEGVYIPTDTIAPNPPNLKPIKEIIIRIENCFNCPFSVKDPSCPYCCINKITFSSGIPEDKRCCEISTIILR